MTPEHRHSVPTPTVASQLVRFLMCWAAVLLIATACAPTEHSLESVSPPADLPRLDLGVRQQFAQIWSDGTDNLSGPEPLDRRNWGALGQWFHVYRYHDSAARCYRNAIKTDGTDPRWPYFLGVLTAESSSTDLARTYFDSALALAPDALHVKVRLADLALGEGDLQQAEQRYLEVVTARPSDPGARFGLAQIALQRRDAKGALALLEPLASEQPEASELSYALGTAWRLIGDSTRAAKALAQIPKSNVNQIALRREDPWIAELTRTDQGSRLVTRKGIQAANRGQTARSAVLFGAAIRLDPEGSEERINYALALSQLKRHRDALEQIAEALRLATPGSDVHVRARLEQGRLLAQAGRKEAAETALRGLLVDHPGEQRARVELSRLLHSRGELGLALEQYEALRKSGMASGELAFWHAAALLGLRQLDKAKSQLEADLTQHPDAKDLRLLWIRTLASSASSAPKPAIDGLRWLDRLDSPMTVLRAETAAMLHASLGQYDKALAWEQAVVDALKSAGLTKPLQIARRRATLYREHKPAATVWEAAERPLDAVVTPPYPARPESR